MSLLSRISNAFRSRRLDRDLEDEQRFHLEARAADLVRAGIDPADAERAARRRFGNTLALRESSRDARLFAWLESLLRDARYGLRMLRKNSVVTAAAVLSLGLALGACAAAFTLIDALILRPLPVADPHRLIYLAYPFDGREADDFAYPMFPDLRDAVRPHADLFAMSQQSNAEAMFRGSEPGRLRTEYVSGDAFGRLGLTPALGRLLTPDDDLHIGAHPVAVLSHGLWMRQFHGDPAAIGSAVTIGRQSFQIVGVMRQGFDGVEPGVRTDIWMPLAMFPKEGFTDAGWSWFRIVGRLRPGVTPDRLHQVVDAFLADYRRNHAANQLPTRLLVRSAANGPSALRAEFERPLWILGIVAALVLLIAASNVTNLFLARGAARQREYAMRIAIGAGRGRLVQQSLVESALLAAASCALGILIARAAAPAIVAVLTPAENPAWLDLRLDARVIGFVAALGAAAAAIFGLAPVLRASAGAGDGRATARLRALRPILAAQVGFSFAVLFLGGLLLASFHRLNTIDLGLSPERVALVETRTQSLPNLLDRVRTLPGVVSAGASGWALLGHSRWTSSIRVGGVDAGAAHVLAVAPGFFDAMGIRVVSGRDFDPRDPQSAAIVNEAFVRRYLHRERRFERMTGQNTTTAMDVVGVVGDAKYRDLRGPKPPTMYVRMPDKGEAVVEIRTAGNPRAIAGSLRTALQRLDPSVRVGHVELQSTLIGNQMIPERLLALLSAFFTATALALAGIGLYGVLAYSVARRTREIGVRIALGARQLSVVRLIVAEITVASVAGLAAGAAGGLALSRFLGELLFEVRPTGAPAFLLPAACFLVAATVAAVGPALRAVRVDPTVALKCE